MKSIQSEFSKLSPPNVMQELFSSFVTRWVSDGSFHSLLPNFDPPSHKEVLDMEVQLFHERLTKRDPKFLMDYIQKMASGEAPFFPITLSMVYDKLVENSFSTISFAPPYNLGAPTTTVRLTPSRVAAGKTWLKCARCSERAQLRDLYDGLHCPQCSENGKNGRGKNGRPFMFCLGCNRLRVARLDVCAKRKCGVRFM